MEGRLTNHLKMTKVDASSRLDAAVANERLRIINADLDLIDAAIADGLTQTEADARYVQFGGGSVMTGSLSPVDDFGTDLGTPSRRFDTVRAAYGRLQRDLGFTPPNTGSGDVATVQVGSEAFYRLTVGTDGLLRWGPGTAERDVSLGRSGPGVLQVTGLLTGYRVPEARVYHTASQATTSGVLLALAFNSERFDTDGIHDTAANTSRLTCRTAGKYLICGSFEMTPGGTGYRQIGVFLNGATLIAVQTIPAMTAVRLAVSTVWDLAVNDYVELCATQDSGGPLNVTAQSNYSPEFSMARVG